MKKKGLKIPVKTLCTQKELKFMSGKQKALIYPLLEKILLFW